MIAEGFSRSIASDFLINLMKNLSAEVNLRSILQLSTSGMLAPHLVVSFSRALLLFACTLLPLQSGESTVCF